MKIEVIAVLLDMMKNSLLYNIIIIFRKLNNLEYILHLSTEEDF